jgi:hypothetical protein
VVILSDILCHSRALRNVCLHQRCLLLVGLPGGRRKRRRDDGGTKNASEERGLSDWMEQLNPINTSVGYNILLILQ